MAGGIQGFNKAKFTLNKELEIKLVLAAVNCDP